MNKPTEILKKVRDIVKDERDAALYACIHLLTDGGTKGIEVFTWDDSLDERLASVRQITGDDLRRIIDIRRMFTEGGSYRTDYFEHYQTYIRPKLVPEPAR